MSAIDSEIALAGRSDTGVIRREPPTLADHWTPIFIIASPRPSTGKTFLARILANFLQVDGRDVKAFEVGQNETSLSKFLPEKTSKSDISSTQGQMALFDQLVIDDGVAKIVDVDHALFGRFFALVEQIGFMSESNGRTIDPMILFPADSHPDSVREYANLRRRMPDAVLVPVFNEAIARGRKLRDQYAFSRAAAVPLQIPLLPPGLKPLAERSGFVLADLYARASTQVPQGPATELCSWTRRTFLEFRELELRLLLEKLRASLQDSLGAH